MNQAELNLYQATVQEFTTRLELITEVVKAIYANQIAYHEIMSKELALLKLQLEPRPVTGASADPPA